MHLLWLIPLRQHSKCCWIGMSRLYCHAFSFQSFLGNWIGLKMLKCCVSTKYRVNNNKIVWFLSDGSSGDSRPRGVRGTSREPPPSAEGDAFGRAGEHACRRSVKICLFFFQKKGYSHKYFLSIYECGAWLSVSELCRQIGTRRFKIYSPF